MTKRSFDPEDLYRGLRTEDLEHMRTAFALDLQHHADREDPCTCLPWPEGSVCEGCRNNARRAEAIAWARGRIAVIDRELERRTRPSYTCPRCGRTSYHPRDLAEKYCARCHAFEDS